MDDKYFRMETHGGGKNISKAAFVCLNVYFILAFPSNNKLNP